MEAEWTRTIVFVASVVDMPSFHSLIQRGMRAMFLPWAPMSFIPVSTIVPKTREQNRSKKPGEICDVSSLSSELFHGLLSQLIVLSFCIGDVKRSGRTGLQNYQHPRDYTKNRRNRSVTCSRSWKHWPLFIKRGHGVMRLKPKLSATVGRNSGAPNGRGQWEPYRISW